MEEVKAKIVSELLGPNGKFELGMDTWECGHKTVRGLCFKRGPRTIKEFVNTTVPMVKEKEFIVYQNERYTFGEFQQLIASLGQALLRDFGIEKGDRVALCMRNYPEWIITFFAVTCIGAVVVPLNGWWQTSELEYGLRDCGAKVIVCDQQRFERVIELLPKTNIRVILARKDPAKQIPSLVQSSVDIFDEVVSRNKLNTAGTEDELFGNVHGHDDIAAIFYTSGTTGHPKGVTQTHRGIMNQMIIAMVAEEIRSQMESVVKGNDYTQQGSSKQQKRSDCAIVPVPLFHVTASHHLMLASLVTGRKLVLMYKWDPEEALKLIEREKPTAWTGVPTMVADILAHPKFDEYDTSSLKVIGGGGGPTPKVQVQSVKEKFRGGEPSQGFGLTETNGGIATISGKDYLERPTSCGKPFPIVQVCVIDPDTEGHNSSPLAPGEVGELLVKSPLVMSHYWNKPEKTAESIITLPEPHGHGWFRTGDIARIDQEGYIHIMDRKKDIVIRGGENISCSEVESAAHEFPGVLECAAFGVKDERMGEVVGLVIVPKANCKSIHTRDLLKVLKRKLANFKVPDLEHIYIQQQALPRGATGKILKRIVRDQVNSLLESKKQPKPKL